MLMHLDCFFIWGSKYQDKLHIHWMTNPRNQFLVPQYSFQVIPMK
uniref:Uncharacterized protein n=1 Tax=Rhizophora mucronata TaxID=61149 RepID=A0A2P2QM66_RHIMU